MRKNIIEFIHCPNCEHGLKLEKNNENNTEVREGELICEKCSNKYVIKEGIIFLHEKLSEDAELEQKAIKKEIDDNKKFFSFQDENWILNYPNNEKLGINAYAERIARLNGENSLNFLKRNSFSNLNILELGANNCWVTAKLAKKNNCIALDIFIDPPKGIGSADFFIKKGVVFFERMVADMIKIPFKKQSFDLVLISSALHHSSNLGRSLKEINRVLKNDGKLVLLNEPSHGFISGDKRKLIDDDVDHGLNEMRYTIKEWKQNFSDAGFKTKISLPTNFISILQSRGKILNFLGLLLSKFPDFLKSFLLKLLTPFIFLFFDGFFNAILKKSK